jgi:hypothetical protein
MAKRRAEKERIARLAREMRERAAAAAAAQQSDQAYEAGLYGEPLAEESLPERAPLQGQRSRPPVYVPPSRGIPQHKGVAGVALRKTRKTRKARKANSRKSRK